MAAVAESCRDFTEGSSLDPIRDQSTALPCFGSSALRGRLSKEEIEADVDFLQHQRAKQPRLGTVPVSIGVPSRSTAMPSKASNNSAAGRKGSQQVSNSAGCATVVDLAMCSTSEPATVCLLADSRHPAIPAAPSAATQIPPQLDRTDAARAVDVMAQQRGSRKRAHFAPGPWKDKFGTADGHPDHEGVVAKAARQCLPRYPVSLSAASVHALENELEGLCPWSIGRLKRRVGLLPVVKRERPFATAAPKARMPTIQLRPRNTISWQAAESDADSDTPNYLSLPVRHRHTEPYPDEIEHHMSAPVLLPTQHQHQHQQHPKADLQHDGKSGHRRSPRKNDRPVQGHL
ncbi:hypothetical protein WJX73_009057 [Symbiochloris irregularis]|uniref:Uncharacterized protein n=1 Tax=Symbiochloris irregularis TaxID=706552 RepID=A0AAW1PFK7_9CHLO